MLGSFQTSKPQRATSSRPCRATRCRTRASTRSDQRSQIAWRRDQPDVVEHPGSGVGGQRLRHERQLDDRPEAGREQPVDHAIDRLEVVLGRPVSGFPIHAQDVVQDGMRADGLDAELVADDAERERQVLADVQPAWALAAQQHGEVLGADDRPPRPVDRARRARRHRPRRSPRPHARIGSGATGVDSGPTAASMLARLATA